jgi:glycosyltransferase involved in cell wall biosynthesis
MNKPMVSVIIPTYKRPETLSRAIDSVLNQTYENIEIIVVDDNEPLSEHRKKTEKLMKNYENIKKVKYIKHSKNRNGSAARNTGIRYSNGKYIAFLDDDDEFLPDKIQNQVEKMESLDETWGACYTSYKKVMSDGTVQYSAEKREGYLLVEALMRTLYIYGGSNLLVRKSVVDKINGFDESFKRNQDLEFLVRILKDYKLAYVDTCSLLIHYDARTTSLTYEQLQEIDKQYLSSFKMFIDELNYQDQKRIYTMIALDSFRYSISYRCILKGITQLVKNKVPLRVFIRFLLYLIIRSITKKSYGFQI